MHSWTAIEQIKVTVLNGSGRRGQVSVSTSGVEEIERESERDSSEIEKERQKGIERDRGTEGQRDKETERQRDSS